MKHLGGLSQRIVFIFCAALLVAALLPAQAAWSDALKDCLDCHDDVEEEAFLASPHSRVLCTGCHHEITDLGLHEDGEIEINPVDCSKCHNDVYGIMAASVHGEQDLACTDCHSSVHDMPAALTAAEAVAICEECHETEYGGSAHGVALAQGNQDAPGCIECHGVHNIPSLGEPDNYTRRRLTVESCRPCHEKEELMSRHGLSSEYVSCYTESYHGKVYSLGYCDRVAGCTDCHTAHDIKAEEDPTSSVNKANLADTCGVSQCHPGANINFSLYASHGSHTDKEKYPVFYWTFMIMSTLLIVVFSFFWLHSLLWWQRSFRERREKRYEPKHAVPEELTLDAPVYQRFDWFGILMHFLMMTSFIGLVFTGLPLKFSHASWAPGLMALLGGAAMAGKIHRYCAIITFAYFLAVNVKVIQFLFFKKTGQNVLQKLFGPDSLFPNIQDGKDIAGMFKWYFNAGPKPLFGRWTYWEKFDFLAVYWGMFAIGFTGLMLWFPTWFAKFLPGWLFNVATIMHSDEALLAAGFIFTVHFFNTHLRPEKFPMDVVIFTGKVSDHEMIEERSLQIPLERQRGNLDKMKTGYAGAGFEFISQLVGYTCLFLGIAGIYLIATGFFGH